MAEEKINMVGKVNAGYTITKQGSNAVIAHNPNAPSPYVAWSYNPKTGDCFWGNYCNTEETAEKYFNKKENIGI